jgi:23S rRNA pseudouridine2605 synthase
MDDPWGRANLSDVVPVVWRDLFHPVGRLDADTSGLLLFSADGGFTQWMLHPRRAIEREYVATVEGEPGQPLTDALAAGVETEEGTFTARVVSIEGPHVRLVVTEGKHRMVRRMLANAGHPVTALRRERFGGFRLGDLAEGEIRPATAEEMAWIAESRGKKKA